MGHPTSHRASHPFCGSFSSLSSALWSQLHNPVNVKSIYGYIFRDVVIKYLQIPIQMYGIGLYRYIVCALGIYYTMYSIQSHLCYGCHALHHNTFSVSLGPFLCYGWFFPCNVPSVPLASPSCPLCHQGMALYLG